MNKFPTFIKIDEPTLFDVIAPNVRCAVCFGTNLWRTPEGAITPCPNKQNGFACEPNEAALRLAEAVEMCRANRIFVEAKWFDLARVLCGYDSNTPCPRKRLEDVFGWSERQIKKVVEHLRADWKLPVGSRKNERAGKLQGYWIITTAADFLEWQRENRASAITQLATNYRLFRHCFPALAGQTSFDYKQQIESELAEAIGHL